MLINVISTYFVNTFQRLSTLSIMVTCLAVSKAVPIEVKILEASRQVIEKDKISFAESDSIEVSTEASGLEEGALEAGPDDLVNKVDLRDISSGAVATADADILELGADEADAQGAEPEGSGGGGGEEHLGNDLRDISNTAVVIGEDKTTVEFGAAIASHGAENLGGHEDDLVNKVDLRDISNVAVINEDDNIGIEFAGDDNFSHDEGLEGNEDDLVNNVDLRDIHLNDKVATPDPIEKEFEEEIIEDILATASQLTGSVDVESLTEEPATATVIEIDQDKSSGAEYVEPEPESDFDPLHSYEPEGSVVPIPPVPGNQAAIVDNSDANDTSSEPEHDFEDDERYVEPEPETNEEILDEYQPENLDDPVPAVPAVQPEEGNGVGAASETSFEGGASAYRVQTEATADEDPDTEPHAEGGANNEATPEEAAHEQTVGRGNGDEESDTMMDTIRIDTNSNGGIQGLQIVDEPTVILTSRDEVGLTIFEKYR